MSVLALAVTGRRRIAALAPLAVLVPTLSLTSSRGAWVALPIGAVTMLYVGRLVRVPDQGADVALQAGTLLVVPLLHESIDVVVDGLGGRRPDRVPLTLHLGVHRPAASRAAGWRRGAGIERPVSRAHRAGVPVGRATGRAGQPRPDPRRPIAAAIQRSRRESVVAAEAGLAGTDDRLSVDVNTEDDRFSVGGPLANGRWYHAAFVYEGARSAVTVYLNGAPVGAHAESASSITPFSSPMWVGCLPEGQPSQGFTGLMDEVAVWHRALSASEIAALANATGPIADR